MKTQSSARPFGLIRLSIGLSAAMVCGLLGATSASAAPLTINVVGVDANGVQTPITTNYRWTVEEDATKLSNPGQPATSANYSFSFHTSYMPVVAAGRVGTSRAHTACNTSASTPPPGCDPDVFRIYKQSLPDLNPLKRYYVSIAAEGHQMGGAPVVFSGSVATATVYVNKYDVPTAQISVFVFNDNNPINGAPDLPQETGLEGFHVRLLEAGGTYGASGGEVTQDAFGNPLGTTYDAGGNVVATGTGIILTDANGVALIQNLYPAKYTILVDPPNGDDWHQTSTIEGTRGVDAWVKNNEPSFFQEFGPPGHHVFIGFTRSGVLVNGVLTGGNTLTGRIVNTHHSRPPVFTFYNGAPVTECWVGLNEPLGGRALYAAPCNKDSTFSIPNVPAGTYELAIWDEPLDMIIAATTICVGNVVGCTTSNGQLGDLPVSSWFGRYQGRVFQDIDGTGLPYFVANFNRPFIAVDPMTGREYESNQAFKAGELKPPFGAGIANNIRFRDGSIYQSTGTKDDGTFAFTEVFPFFNFMVAEIDYARYRATSANVVVDDGGKIVVGDGTALEPGNDKKLWKSAKGLFGSNDPDLAYDPWTRLSPQKQNPSECPNDPTKLINGDCYFRTETVEGGPGAILLEAMQTFLGSTNHVEWGKTPYKIDENGGIAGIVYYAITRAEDDPRYAAAENWEPGIPRVQVNVFLDCDGDGKVDKPKNDGTGQCEQLSSNGYTYDPPDVDNYPFCWRNPDGFVADNPSLCPDGPGKKGPEDVKRSRTLDANTFSYGDVFKWGAPGLGPDAQVAIGLGKTDSWDDSIPTGCPDVTPYSVPSTGEVLDCFDGLRNYNQLRPAVFDGGFAFGRVAGQEELPMVIGDGAGTYILEAVAPPGYLHQGNGDKNVVFGDSLKATPAALPHECVGQELPVPADLTLFPGEPNPNYSAGATWRKCDMKAVPLVPGLNAAPNFFMFTEAPVAGHGVGFILDDTATEFNHLAPNFGEKYSPPHLPVSIRDWTDREISRVYSDQFGSYNFLVPSSFTINPPYPSGVMPSMMTACMNHPGPVPDPNDATKLVIDPFYNRNYSTFCYTFQYLAGKTTYLDTPVLPVSAFASVESNPLDCECENGTPGIYSVNNASDGALPPSTNNGPWVANPTTANPNPNRQLTIVSRGNVDVVNPAFNAAVVLKASCAPSDTLCTTDANDVRLKRTIQRDYGFGPATTPSGTVTLGTTALTINSWSNGLITATVPANALTGQLMVKRGDNLKESIVGVTVHVGGSVPAKVNASAPPNSGAYQTIQAAIDAAPAQGSPPVITVAPGVYNEFVIMDKRVRLQGWGAGSVTINAAKSNSTAVAAWRSKINARADVTFDLLPGQTTGIDPANNEPLLFGAEEGPGILVVGRLGGNNQSGNPLNDCDAGTSRPLIIDGLTLTGADSGGGLLASGYACGVQISNNRVVGNYGTYGGGIRVGHTVLATVDAAGTPIFTDGVNRQPNIHHNWIAQNGATEAGGSGGITLGTGSNGYAVASNYVCGNFSMADGGGLSHLGQSTGSITGNANNRSNTIDSNKFIFNQTFNQSADPMGGGISIAAQIPIAGGVATGTGDVVVNRNLLQGNQAGAGAGGGASIARTLSGDDIVLTNNIVINNMTAYAGGGVALSGNAGAVRLVNNTIASNVSTATNRQAFGSNNVNQGSLPQVAGVAVLGGNSPTLLNDIIWANRSYNYLDSTPYGGLYDPIVGTPSYRDLGRVGNGASLAPTYSVLTGPGAGYEVVNDHLSNPASANNRLELATSTALVVKKNEFFSQIDPSQPLVLQDATVTLRSALTFDETGNFINVIYSPLTLWEITGNSIGAPRADYHITGTSVALNNGLAPTSGNFVPATDYDGQNRTAPIDIGADENLIPAPAMHVGDLDWTAVTISATQWRATVTVTVHDAAHAPVANATVNGTWSAGNATGRTLTCTTNASGQCTVTSGQVTAATNTTVSFSVTSVVASAFVYQASANHDPDAAPQASNGTTITASPLFFMHLGDLDWTATNTSATQWSATVTIAVHDSAHAAVANATVSVSWISQGSGGGSCTTNAAGTCQVTRTGISRTGAAGAAATATVTNVTTPSNTLLYAQGVNHDPDSGAQASNGTSITVPRP